MVFLTFLTFGHHLFSPVMTSRGSCFPSLSRTFKGPAQETLQVSPHASNPSQFDKTYHLPVKHHNERRQLPGVHFLSSIPRVRVPHPPTQHSNRSLSPASGTEPQPQSAVPAVPPPASGRQVGNQPIHPHYRVPTEPQPADPHTPHPPPEPPTKMPPPPTLPPPRTILNALLSRIATIPLSSTPTSSNPLSLTPPSHRHLIITLHVLFPTLMLPALDLLDRRLIVRIILDDSLSYRPRHPDTRRGDGKEAEFYLVSSSVPPAPPRRQQQQGDGEAPAAVQAAGRFYIVRVGTWHCTCAGFAFAMAGGGREEEGRDDDPGEEKEGVGFGGVSVDGPGEGTPVCKHLLACLLAERWEGVRGYVRERRVGREEMGGLVADI